jgi:hypothetical protein
MQRLFIINTTFIHIYSNDIFFENKYRICKIFAQSATKIYKNTPPPTNKIDILESYCLARALFSIY